MKSNVPPQGNNEDRFMLYYLTTVFIRISGFQQDQVLLLLWQGKLRM